MVPCSLRKNELYYTANRIKKYEFSEMQLFHKGRFLSEDETSIDCVENGDEIKIIEELHGVDFSYYELFLLRHKNENKITVFFHLYNGARKLINITLNTSVEEMIKIFFFEINVPDNKREYFCLLYNSNRLNFHDKSTLKEKGIVGNCTITVIKNDTLYYKFGDGKTLQVIIKDKNKEIYKTVVGTLQTIEDFYNKLSNEFPRFDFLKIEINGKEFLKNDRRTFSSVGIRDDFTCYVEIIEKK